MAEGYFRKYTSANTEIYSAGIEKEKIDPIVIDLMMQDGIDISQIKQHKLDEFKHVDFDFILTYDEESEIESHHLPSKPVKYHFDFHKMIPADLTKMKKKEVYSLVRDKIKRSIRSFILDHFTDTRTA
jgi:arsenate reductase